MSEGHPPALTDAQTYRFISDPGHKENLSGRVGVACLTCRRKKIKCSGEANCRTCREKGIICEGFPERKRPRKSGLDSSDHTLAFKGGIDRKKRIDPNKKSSISRIAALTALEEAANNTGRHPESSSVGLRANSPYSNDSKVISEPEPPTNLVRRNSSRRNSMPTHMYMDTWQVQQPQRPTHHNEPSATHNEEEASDAAVVFQPTQAAEPLPVGEDNDEEAGWWFGAGGEFIAMPPEARTRRQTVACLYPASETAEPRYHIPSGVHGFFDDTSLLANHAQGTDFVTGDFSAWLDANAPDLASMLPSTYPPDTSIAFEQPSQQSDHGGAGPVTQATQTQNGYVEDYFNQGWPK